MKFPKILSKERLSLLSPEDRKIYEQEHKTIDNTIFSSTEDFIIEEPLFEDDLTEEDYHYSEEYKKMTKRIVSEECDAIYNDLFDDLLSYENFNEIKNEILNNYNLENDEKYNNFITEGAEGQDAFAWIRSLKIGWIGTLLATSLGALGTGLAYLITAGKDKIAMMRLKKYFNLITETIDLGRLKRRPWYSFLMPKKNAQFHGEYNNACFRTIQETADRNMCNSVMNAAMKLGYFKSGEMMNILNSAQPQSGSGLDEFKNNVLSQLNVIIRPVK